MQNRDSSGSAALDIFFHDGLEVGFQCVVFFMEVFNVVLALYSARSGCALTLTVSCNQAVLKLVFLDFKSWVIAFFGMQPVKFLMPF